MTSAVLNPGASSNSGSRHDFKATEDSRPDWDTSKKFVWHKTSRPGWKLGDGAANKIAQPKQICIDPYEPGRPAMFNYRLITSGVIPRPVAVISTISVDGKSSNLAPYSFFQAMSNDPPTFVVGHAMSEDVKKDTLKNLTETGECVISLMNEDILEASNAAAVGSPHGISEWALTGLTPGKSEVVKPSRILEAAFSIECKLVHSYPIQSRARPGDTSMVMTVVEGVRFWVREDAVDADRKMIDPAKSKPIGRLFGIGYTRVMEGFQIPWPDWNGEKEVAERNGLVRRKVQGQL